MLHDELTPIPASASHMAFIVLTLPSGATVSFLAETPPEELCRHVSALGLDDALSPYLTTKQTARYLQISERNVHRLVEEKRLPVDRVGRRLASTETSSTTGSRAEAPRGSHDRPRLDRARTCSAERTSYADEASISDRREPAASHTADTEGPPPMPSTDPPPSSRFARQAVPKHPGVYWRTKNGRRPTPPYQAIYRNQEARQIAKSGFPTIESAEAWLAQQRTDKNRGILVKPNSKTVQEWAELWLANHPNLSPGTRRLHEQRLRDYVYPVIGRRRLSGSSGLTKHDVLAVKRTMEAPPVAGAPHSARSPNSPRTRSRACWRC